MSGLWFVQGNLVRDLAALNKMELLPWDVWGCMGGDDDFTDEERDLMDRAAMVTLAGDAAFSEVCALYLDDERLKVPKTIASYTSDGHQSVDLSAPQ